MDEFDSKVSEIHRQRLRDIPLMVITHPLTIVCILISVALYLQGD